MNFQLDIGLSQVHRVEPDKLLPHKDDVIEKMIFHYGDYLCFSAVLQDEKPKMKGGLFFVYSSICSLLYSKFERQKNSSELSFTCRFSGFATDREYQARRSTAEDGYAESTFEPWDEDGAGEIDETKTDDLTNGGWSADDMFHVNKALGVESTYVENMSQYTK